MPFLVIFLNDLGVFYSSFNIIGYFIIKLQINNYKLCVFLMISLFILNYKLLCLGLNFTILMAHFKSKKKLENWEKIIPNQPFISDLYSEKDPIEKKILDLIFSSTQIKSPKETFNLVESDMFSIEEMSSSPVTLNLIKFLLRLIKPKRILEIGTFVGVATMIMAKELGENGKIYTIRSIKSLLN